MLGIVKKIGEGKRNFAHLIKHGFVKRGRNSGMGDSIIKVTNELTAKHIRDGKVIGVRNVKNKKVTDDFVDFIVAQLQTETSAFGDFKWHDSGTGVGAEDQTDSALGTSCAETRLAGTQAEGAQTYEYKSVVTHTYAGSFAITEHGLFNAITSGILMDRTVFSAINVVASDQIEFTFTIQFAAEA